MNKVIEDNEVIKICLGNSVFISYLLYILARLFLIVEVFRSLLYLPPGAFIETWSGSFPHFGG